MANFTERQLELMGLEEYEPGKYRKKVAIVNELPIEIQKQDAIFKSRNDPSPVKTPESGGIKDLHKKLTDDLIVTGSSMLHTFIDTEFNEVKQDRVFMGVDPAAPGNDKWAMRTMVSVKAKDGSISWMYPEDVPDREVKGFDIDPLDSVEVKPTSDKEHFFNDLMNVAKYNVPFPGLIQEMLDVKESPEVVMKRFQEQGIIFHNSETSGKVFEVTVNNFTEEITIAQSQRAKPYIKGKKTPKLPQKYMTDEYGWDEKDRLIHKGSGEIIASNPTKVGQPRMWRVNGQALYNSYLTDQQRNTYMTKLSEYLFPYFTDQAYITAKHLKLKVDFYLMDRGSKNIDNDNRWIWIKAIRDVMKKTILPEDSPYIIYGDEFNTYFTPIESETRMVVSLWANT